MKETKPQYSSCRREVSEVALSIRRFKVEGLPTCLSWYGSEDHPREVCRFYGTRQFGTQPVCLAMADNIHYYDDVLGGYLCRPVEGCPVWGSEEGTAA